MFRRRVRLRLHRRGQPRKARRAAGGARHRRAAAVAASNNALFVRDCPLSAPRTARRLHALFSTQAGHGRDHQFPRRGAGDGAREADRAVAALIARVGERVRRARDRKGIPRRVLSEKSGVSPALPRPARSRRGQYLDRALAAGGPCARPQDRMAGGRGRPLVVRGAADGRSVPRAPRAEMQARVLAVLSPEPAAARRAHRICLVGLRGAGKSTLGRRAGDGAGRALRRAQPRDRGTGRHAGRRVDGALRPGGLPAARSPGHRAGDRHPRDDDPRRRRRHRRRARYLQHPAHAVPHDLGQGHARPSTWRGSATRATSRPMAGNPEAMEQLKSILTAREALYDRALGAARHLRQTEHRRPAEPVADVLLTADLQRLETGTVPRPDPRRSHARSTPAATAPPPTSPSTSRRSTPSAARPARA